MTISQMAALSAPGLTMYTQLSTPKEGAKKTVKDPFTPRRKCNATCINSQYKLVGKTNSGWRIRASQWPSVSTNPENLSAGLSQGLESSLALAEIFDLNGNMAHLTDLWKDRKAVVGFARHFGCVLCRKRADILASQKSQMDAAGVALVLIGPGNIEQAKTFAEQTKFPGEIYADPNHTSFNALKFVSGVSTTFTPTAAMKIIELYAEGYRQDWGLSFERDTVNRGGWQQGGILVAGPGRDNILYLHKDKEAGDDPNIEDVMKACCI